jgi:hypothetical protein
VKQPEELCNLPSFSEATCWCCVSSSLSPQAVRMLLGSCQCAIQQQSTGFGNRWREIHTSVMPTSEYLLSVYLAGHVAEGAMLTGRTATQAGTQAGDCVVEIATCFGARCTVASCCSRCGLGLQIRINWHTQSRSDNNPAKLPVVISCKSDSIDQPADGASSVDGAAGKRILLQGASLYPVRTCCSTQSALCCLMPAPCWVEGCFQ